MTELEKGKMTDSGHFFDHIGYPSSDKALIQTGEKGGECDKNC